MKKLNHSQVFLPQVLLDIVVHVDADDIDCGGDVLSWLDYGDDVSRPRRWQR